MIFKLGIEHNVLKLYKIYINDYPELTLTYVTAVKFGETCFYTYWTCVSMSVYRAIGPMVLVFQALNIRFF